MSTAAKRTAGTLILACLAAALIGFVALAVGFCPALLIITASVGITAAFVLANEWIGL